MTVSSLSQVEAILTDFTPPERDMRGKYDLSNIKNFMEYLGNPQDSYKTIHVAGTSGKTSTAYYIAALIKQTGNKVGLTISPHVDAINERIQIDLVPLENKLYCQQFNIFLRLLDSFSSTAKVKLTYFEILVAFAFWEFRNQKVDYAVIEVGLGGLLDATNVITRLDKLSVITDIGFDHQNVLGNKITDIARQKIGIVLPGSYGYCLNQNSEILDVFKKEVNNLQAEIQIYKQTNESNNQTLPLYQRRNWFLANKVVEQIIKRDNLDKLTAKQQQLSQLTYIPARMEIIKKKNKTIILDAAHNPQKMKALVPSLKDKYPDQKLVVLLALLKSKDFRIKGVLKELLPITSHLIVTQFEAKQDLRKFSSSGQLIKETCQQMGFNNVEVIEDSRAAFEALKRRPEKLGLITGSFYLLHDLHQGIMS